MTLEIPEPDRKLLEDWLGGDREDVENVLACLESVEPSLRLGPLAREVTTRTGIDVAIVNDLLEAFLNLAFTVSRFDQEEKERATELIARAVLGHTADAATKARLEERTRRVLEIRSIEITSKALDVRHDSANRFCSARTISSIRPVFSEEELRPAAAVIVHELKLVYHAGPDFAQEQTFITCDRRQLEEIRGVIDRAIQKDGKLSVAAAKLDLVVLGAEPRDER